MSLRHRGTDIKLLLLAAHFMKEHHLRTFDTLPGALCQGDEILSSDAAFERVGLKRIPLERYGPVELELPWMLREVGLRGVGDRFAALSDQKGLRFGAVDKMGRIDRCTECS